MDVQTRVENWVIINSCKVIVSCHTQHKMNTTPLTLTLLDFSERGLGTRLRLKQGCTIHEHDWGQWMFCLCVYMYTQVDV